MMDLLTRRSGRASRPHGARFVTRPHECNPGYTGPRMRRHTSGGRGAKVAPPSGVQPPRRVKATHASRTRVNRPGFAECRTGSFCMLEWGVGVRAVIPALVSVLTVLLHGVTAWGASIPTPLCQPFSITASLT